MRAAATGPSTAQTASTAHAQPGSHWPPQDLLTHLNRQLTRSYTRNGTFVTACYAVLDPKTRTLTYSLAGHNPPRLVRHSEKRVISLDQQAMLPMGIDDDQAYRQVTVTLEPGDLLLLYTDGITETMSAMTPQSATREMYGVERLDDHLLACASGKAAEQCIQSVRTDVARFANSAPPTDDQTLIALRCL